MRRRVFLLDDHPLVREWLSSLVSAEADLEVCGQAEDARVGLAGILEARPDLLVVDLSLPRGSGLELIKEVRGRLPSTRVLVLSMHDEASVAERAFRAGAHGYAMKRESGPTIVEAMRTVLAGKVYATHSLAQELASRFMAAPTRGQLEPADALSDREFEVFKLRGSGRASKEIAEHLGVSAKTVGSYEARIREKLGYATANELWRAAVLWYERQRGL